MSNKVLIIGGAGFIGMNIAKFLVKKRSCELTLADHKFWRNNSDYFTDKEEKKIKFIEQDFTSLAAFEVLDKDYDHVYMLASIVGVNNTLENPAKVIHVNTSLILNCLEWLKNSRVKKALFSSTSETYSGSTEILNFSIPTDENIPLCIENISNPRYTYAITKILGESAFLSYSKKYNFETTIVRYHNAFGPDMGFKHVIPHLVERFIKNETPFKMYGYNQTRSFSFIDDTAEASVLAMENKNSNSEIFHIGNAEEISIELLIKSVGKLMGYFGEYEVAPTFPGSVSRRCPNISKAIKLLGYNPKVDWEKGLEITVNWYKNYFLSNNPPKQDGFKKIKHV